MVMTYIPPDEREGKVCAICGTTKSVKYHFDKDGSKYYACNKCALYIITLGGSE